MEINFRRPKLLLSILVALMGGAMLIGLLLGWDTASMWGFIVGTVGLASAFFSAAGATGAADIALAAEQRAAAAEQRATVAERVRTEREYWRSLGKAISQKRLVLDLATTLVQHNAWRAQQAGQLGSDRQKLAETDIKNSVELLEKMHAEAKPLLVQEVDAIRKSSDDDLAKALTILDGLHVFHDTMKEKLLRDLAQMQYEIRVFKVA